MEVDIRDLKLSSSNFKFLIDRQRKIEYIKNILDNSVDTFFEYKSIDDANKHLMVLELYMETLLFYANSIFDILLDIIKTETTIRIIQDKIYDPKYQKILAETSKIGKYVVDFVTSHEFNFIRNATNLIKHENLIGTTLTIGSLESGVFLKPFEKGKFKILSKTSHTTIYDYYYILIRKSIRIIEEIINIKDNIIGN